MQMIQRGRENLDAIHHHVRGGSVGKDASDCEEFLEGRCDLPRDKAALDVVKLFSNGLVRRGEFFVNRVSHDERHQQARKNNDNAGNGRDHDPVDTKPVHAVSQHRMHHRRRRTEPEIRAAPLKAGAK